MSQKYPMIVRGGPDGSGDPASRKQHREDAAWTRLYEQVENPAVAEAVVQALIEAPDSFPDCQALYLTALATISRHQARRERARWLAAVLRGVARLPARSCQAMLAALPRKAEPAIDRIDVLNGDPVTAPSVKTASAKAGVDASIDECPGQDVVEIHASTVSSRQARQAP